MSIRLLIDGYNLLFASDVFASPAGPPTLERTRTALLQFLADRLEEKVSRRTTIVFDATQAPSGLPRETSFAGIQVLFSRTGQEADDLLEDLIASERAPREMTVVSSDHRVQRAARQRGAKFVDSEQWIGDLRRASQSAPDVDATKGELKDSPEIQKWLAEFGDVDSRKLAPREPEALRSPPPPTLPAPTKKRSKKEVAEPTTDEKPAWSGWNPFPPGYGDDVVSDNEPRRED